MNRILARAVGLLNGLLAIIIILVGAILGAVSIHNVVGFVVGGILGFIAAVIMCGVIALAIEIDSELIRIRETLERSDREGSKHDDQTRSTQPASAPTAASLSH
jgi:uncharacterized membrane protein